MLSNAVKCVCEKKRWFLELRINSRAVSSQIWLDFDAIYEHDNNDDLLACIFSVCRFTAMLLSLMMMTIMTSGT